MRERDEIVDQIPSLRRYARALTASVDEADDLVQDCLERACSRWHLFHRDRELRPWLFAIMRNLFISAQRSRVRRPRPVPLDEELQQLGAAPEQGGRLQLHDLSRALLELTEDQREVVLLVGLEGFSYAEAARIVDAPVGTVMSRLARGRERLRRLLDGEEVALVRRVK
jgi:RNA polymerase sigma-70 factor (ECF subfamily)